MLMADTLQEREAQKEMKDRKQIMEKHIDLQWQELE